MKVIAGMSLKDMAQLAQNDYDSEIVAAKLDNVLNDLQNEVGKASIVEFVPLNSVIGWRIYQRSVLFLLFTAVYELYPQAEVIAKFTVNKGLFCEIEQLDEPLNQAMVAKISARMQEICAQQRLISKETLPKAAAVKLFKDSRQIEKANLIAALNRDMVSIYRCGEFYDYLYGAMLGATTNLTQFA